MGHAFETKGEPIEPDIMSVGQLQAGDENRTGQEAVGDSRPDSPGQDNILFIGPDDYAGELEDSPPHFLVVDDEEAVGQVIIELLDTRGFKADWASTPTEALSRLAEKEYDTVITDLRMPGMDGIELARLVKESHPHTPIILNTGHGTLDSAIEALRSEFQDYIKKPFSTTELFGAVDRALERRRLTLLNRHYQETLEQINDVVTAVSQGKDSQEVFELIDDTLGGVLPVDRIAVALLDEDVGVDTLEVKFVGGERLSSITKGYRARIRKSSTLWTVAEKKKARIIRNLKRFMEGTASSSEETRILVQEGALSSLTVPLIVSDRCIGFMFLSSDKEDSYTRQHAQFLHATAGQLASTIEKSNLIFRLGKTNEDLVHFQSELRRHNAALEQKVQERTRDLIETQDTAVFSLAKLAESRDYETGLHLERMRNFVRALALQLQESEKHKSYIDDHYVADIFRSAPLHDIGKVGIQDSILLKPGKLTPEEFEIMKTHASIGGETLAAADSKLRGESFLRMGKEIAFHHHEKWNGTGYPEGLKGEEIPLSARIVALADVYDALRMKRVYKPAFPHEKARDIIISEREKHFDPDIVDAFLAAEDDFLTIHHQYMEPGEMEETETA